MRNLAFGGALFFLIVSFSYAQFGVLPPAGVTPESPFFFFERVVENIQTLFTFGDVARIKRSVRLAEERLAEAAVLANKNSAAFEESLALFRKEFDSAIARLERVTLPDVRIIVNESVNKHFIVLEEIRDLVSEQHRPLVEEAISVSKQNQYSTLKAILEVDPNRAISLGLDAAKERLLKTKKGAEAGKIAEFEANIAHARLLFDAIISIPDEKIDALREVANGSVRIVELLDEIYEKKGALPDQKRVIERITDFKTHAVQTHIRFLTQLLRKDPKSVVSILTFVVSGRLNKMERIAEGDGGEIAFVFPDYENYIVFGKEVMKRAGRYRVNLEEETVQDTLEKDFVRQLAQLQGLKGKFISYRESFDRVIAGIKEIQKIEPEPLPDNQLPDIPLPDVPRDESNGEDKTLPIPASEPPLVRIFASITQIKKGEEVEIRWESANADSCIASEGWSGTKSVSGNEKVFPQNTTTYVITCSSNSGRASDLIIVTVVSPTLPAVNISANPLTIKNGESSVLTWISSNANTCIASDSWSGSKSTSGSQTVTLSTTRTYVLTCSNANGSSASNVTVTVSALAPIVTFSASPSNIEKGNSSVLSWSSSNADTCVGSGGWSGAKNSSGSQNVSPTATATYTITCSGAGGSASKNVTVTVTGGGVGPPPPPPPPPSS